jgi:hypothetical protein
MGWWDHLLGYQEPGSDPGPWGNSLSGAPPPPVDPVEMARVGVRSMNEGTAGVVDILGNGVGALAKVVDENRSPLNPKNLVAPSRSPVPAASDTSRSLMSMAFHQVEDSIHREAQRARVEARKIATDREVAQHPVMAIGGRILPEVAAYSMLGPALIPAYESLRDPDHMLKGFGRGLAGTALPLKIGRAATTLMPETAVAARAFTRAAIPGLAAYRLSGGDPYMGGVTALTGLLSPGAAAAGRTARSAEAWRGMERAAETQAGASGLRAAAKELAPPLPLKTGERVYSIGLDNFNGGNLRKVIRDSALRLEAAHPERKLPRKAAAVEAAASRLQPQISENMSLHDLALMGDTPGLSDETARALDNVLGEVGEKHRALEEALRKSPADAELQAEFLAQTVKLSKFVQLAGDSRQNWGRTGLVYQMGVGEATQRLQAAQRALPEGAPVEDVAKMLLELPTPASRVGFWRGLEAAKGKVKLGKDTVYAIWTSNNLSALGTAELNVLGNATMQGVVDPIDKLLGASIGAVASGARRAVGLGPSPNRTYFREVLARWRGMSNGWARAAEGARANFVSGERPPHLGGNVKQEYEIPAFLERGPGRNTVLFGSSQLEAGDVFFKQLAYDGEIAAKATHEALKKGLRGAARRELELKRTLAPLPETLESAVKHADRMTFTTGLGPVGEAFRRFLGPGKGLRIGGFENVKMPGSPWVVPYFRTLLNLTKEGATRGPLGLAPGVKVESRFWGDIKAGGAARHEAIGRTLIPTTGLLAFGAYLADKVADGTITAAQPEDEAEAARFKNENRTPYAFRITTGEGEQQDINFGRLAPIGPAIGMIVSGIKGWQDAQSEEETKKGAALMNAGLHTLRDNMINQTGFLGALDFTNMLNDAQRYSQQFINRMAGSVVPGIVRQVARTQDPKRRLAEGPLEAIQANIPWLRSQLPAERGQITGEELEYGEPLGGPGSPVWSSKPSQRRVFKILDETGAKISPASKTLEIEIPRKGEAPQAFRKKLRERLAAGEFDKPRAKIVEKLLYGGYSRALNTEEYQEFVGRSAGKAASEVEFRDRYRPKNLANPELKHAWQSKSPEWIAANLEPAEPGQGFWSMLKRDVAQKAIDDIYDNYRSAAKKALKDQLLADLRKELGQ